MVKKIFALIIVMFATTNCFKEKKIRPFDTEAVLSITKKYLPDENLVILNAGTYDGKEIPAMKRFWSNCTIHAFEPVPEIFKILKKKTAKRSNVICYQLALAENNEEKEFFMSHDPRNPGKPAMSGSLLEPKEHLKYSHIQFNDKIKVHAMNLDDWAQSYGIEKIDFLWLDLQGYELPVIKSAPKIVSTAKAIYTEVEFVEAYKGQPLWEDVKAWMDQNDFILVAREFDIPVKKTWFSSALFIKKDLVK